MRLQNLKVCHDHLSNETIHHPAGKILEVKVCQSYFYRIDKVTYFQIIKGCPKNCHYESGFLNDSSQIRWRSPLLFPNQKIKTFSVFSSNEEEKAMLSIGNNTKTGNFCLTYGCNSDKGDTGLWDVMVSVVI